MTDLKKTLDDLKLLNALCHGTVLDDAISLLKELDTVEHAKEVLCRNGWEKMRFPEGTIGKWDDPEIVRCKNCKWRGTEACFCKAKDDVKDDWFCSEGEKAVK